MLKRNLIANYLGQGWTALPDGAGLHPLYIQYLGIEAYGLIGLFAVLQAWLALLDMGLTPRRFQVRALASRGHGAAGRRSRGSAPHRMLAVHEPAMTDPTRREDYDAPGKTRLERYFQDGGCEGVGLGLCWIPVATRRALCFHPRRLDAERAVRPARVAVRAAESRPCMVTPRHGFNRLREESESLRREIESGAGGGADCGGGAGATGRPAGADADDEELG